MQELEINSDLVKECYPTTDYIPELVFHFKEKGWTDDIPRIPAIKFNNFYSFADGHKRVNSARRAGLSILKIILYNEKDRLEDIARRTGNDLELEVKDHKEYLANPVPLLL